MRNRIAASLAFASSSRFAGFHAFSGAHHSSALQSRNHRVLRPQHTCKPLGSEPKRLSGACRAARLRHDPV